MNIFFLDPSPLGAASALYARHKLKMLVESPQCMHERYKTSNPIAAYRMYYVAEKGHIFDANWGDSIAWGPGWAEGAPSFPTNSVHRLMSITGFEDLLPSLVPAHYPE